jgi:uncharacterized membrane-anchored protein
MENLIGFILFAVCAGAIGYLVYRFVFRKEEVVLPAPKTRADRDVSGHGGDR